MIDKKISDTSQDLDECQGTLVSNYIVLYENISSNEDKKFYEAIIRLIIQIESDKVIEAVDATEILYRDRPNSPELYFIFGLASWSLQDFGRAIPLMLKAHEADPDCRDYVDALATVYTQAGKLSDGLNNAKLATALDPHKFISPLLPIALSNYYSALSSTSASKHYVNGLIQYNLRRFQSAAIECEAELSINTQHLDCYILYGKSLNELGRYDEAVIALKKAIEIDNTAVSPIIETGKSLYHLGRHEDAIHAHLRALELDQSVETCAAAMDGVKYLGSNFDSEKSIFRAAMDSCFDKIKFYKLPKPRGEKLNSDIIHVGIFVNSIFSGDYYQFFEPLLRHHDTRKFKIIVYNSSVIEDAFFTQIKNNVELIRPVFDIDSETLTVILTNDQIDILIDLSGYSDGNQATILKQNVAPVQLGYLKYPYGINSPGTNFIISDRSTAEIDKAQVTNNAQIIITEDCLYSREPFTHFPDPVPLPAIKNYFITFGGYCDMATLTLDVATSWGEILKTVPNACLLLGGVPNICDLVKNTVSSLFKDLEVADRIKFIDSQPGLETTDVIFYNSIDIFLDSFGLSSINTIIESLWMGVPTVSIRASDRPSMLGASILTAAGKTQWITSTTSDYINLAQSLSSDKKVLATIRKNLRTQIEGSNLFNTVKATKAWEKALITCLKATRNVD